MAGSTYGKILTMTTWGESHGAGVGVVVDGCPAGLALCEEDVQRYLDRRKPGQSRFTTKRSESDTVEILSGVFEGRTTGTPISMLVRNQDQHSKDYSEIASYYRPGHADYTFDEKYGFRDYRGGGRSSGRETIGRVAAGAIAAKLLESLNIQVKAYTKAIGPVEVAPDRFDLAECEKNKLYMPDAAAAAEAEQIVFEKNDYFIKEDPELKNEIQWIIPNAQKNTMEPIRLTLGVGGSTYPDSPHEGEEFGYVLSGSILIHLGNRTYKAKKGESFYYTSDKTHYLESRSGATILWVSSPPSF